MGPSPEIKNRPFIGSSQSSGVGLGLSCFDSGLSLQGGGTAVMGDSPFSLSSREQSDSLPFTKPNSIPCAHLVLEVLDHSKDKHYRMAARCKKWGCPYCGPINARNLSKNLSTALESYLEEGKLTKAKMRYTVKTVTLTCPGESFRDENMPAEAGRLIKKALKSLLKSLKDHYGMVEYFWVCEYQHDLYPHIHLLVLGQGIAGKGVMRFINDRWSCLGMGRSGVEVVRSVRGTSCYMTKYLSKSGQKDSVAGAHTWAMSRALQSRVVASRKLSAIDYQVVKIFRRNDDGSTGGLIWEVASGESFVDAMERQALHELLDFFDTKINAKGEQILLWEGN